MSRVPETGTVAEFLSPEDTQPDVTAQIAAEKQEVAPWEFRFNPNDPLYEPKFNMEFGEKTVIESILNEEIDIADLSQQQEIYLVGELNVLEQVLSGDLQMGEMGFNQATILVRMLGDKQTIPGMQQNLLAFAQGNQFGLERMSGLLQEAADINAAKVAADARFSAGTRMGIETAGMATEMMDHTLMSPDDISKTVEEGPSQPSFTPMQFAS